ncbi:CDP-glucose 4,6-dehydratase [Desulfurivibrio sp. D14AmB]|uniref:CDP-glucose 4,6-dehydratase n=1 Tax=Desulfurivibrio sp. D14AmB TaxID=3374370 RepID=UPI00376F3E31
MFKDIYAGKKIFLTGHTGFKGSWLAFWLTQLGAEVTGYSLAPETEPNHFGVLNIPMRSIIGDVRDADKLGQAVRACRPDLVFHLAAQPLVRRSYREPVATFAANVMGVVNLFEACRGGDSVQAIVNITSDKCYENREWLWGYRENDPMGGHDPYSASKGCSELITASWRNSFFPPARFGKTHHTLLASARAGNVIGGGDWSEDRLIPDIIRAIAANEAVTIRSPQATRPWQHVLEPISGYLLLGQKLLEGDSSFAEGWNFGPAEEGSITVGEVVSRVKSCWDRFEYVLKPDPHQPHEAGLLKLDCSKARARLHWQPVWESGATFAKTINWYRGFYEERRVLTADDLTAYLDQAKAKNIGWAKD